MSTESTILLENITASADGSTYVFGTKKPGAGYHRRGDGVHTATYAVDSFIGSVKIQGTLALYPADSDFFDIDGTEIGLGSDSSAWTSTGAVNFIGNFVWIRAAYNVQNGSIVQILYNF